MLNQTSSRVAQRFARFPVGLVAVLLVLMQVQVWAEVRTRAAGGAKLTASGEVVFDVDPGPFGDDWRVGESFGESSVSRSQSNGFNFSYQAAASSQIIGNGATLSVEAESRHVRVSGVSSANAQSAAEVDLSVGELPSGSGRGTISIVVMLEGTATGTGGFSFELFPYGFYDQGDPDQVGGFNWPYPRFRSSGTDINETLVYSSAFDFRVDETRELVFGFRLSAGAASSGLPVRSGTVSGTALISGISFAITEHTPPPPPVDDNVFRFVSTTGGAFLTATNWKGVNEPTLQQVPIKNATRSDAAVFDLAGSYTVTLSGPVNIAALDVIGGGVNPTFNLAGYSLSTGGLRIGDGAMLTMAGGTAQVAAPMTLDNGVLAITGNSAKVIANQTLSIGKGGEGVLFLNEGGQAEAKGAVKLGVEAASNGTITVAGEEAKFTAKDGMTIAQAGHGLLWIREGGAAAISEKLKLGVEVGSTGNVLVEDEDSKLELKGDITIGDGGIGNVSVLAGGKVETKELKDEFGLLVLAEGKSKVGAELGSTGRLLVDGEGSKFISKGSFTLGDKGNGALEVTDGGSVTVPSAKFGSQPVSFGIGTVEGAGAKLTINGALTLGDFGTGELTILNGATASAASLKLGTQFNAIGELTVGGSGSRLTLDGGLTAGVLGNADVQVLAGGQLIANTLAIADGLSVANVAVTIDGTGSLLSTGDTIVGKQGTGSLVIRDGGRVNSGLLPVLDLSDPDAVLVISPGIPANATISQGVFAQGTALVTGAGSTWEVGGELIVGDGGFGVLQVEHGGQLKTAGGRLGATVSEGPGHVTIINPTSRWMSSEAIVIAGISTGGGTGTGQGILNILDSATVEAPAVHLGAGGMLAGVGQIVGQVIQTGGVIVPGFSPGKLVIDGDYEQLGGVLQIEFAGLGHGQFDILQITGDAFLGGTLEMLFIDGYLPKTGDVLGFLEVGGELTGGFAEIVFPNLLPGFAVSSPVLTDGVYSLTALTDGELIPEAAMGFDAWLQLHGIVPEATGQSGVDGVPYLLKYAFNLDPTRPDVRRITTGMIDESETVLAGLPVPAMINGRLRLYFLQPVDQSGITVTPIFGDSLSSDPAGWDAQAETHQARPVVGGYELRYADDPAITPGPRRFGRIKVERETP